MARRNLWKTVQQGIVEANVTKLTSERKQVRRIIKDEIESLMRLGAEVTGMHYYCKSSGTSRLCITPKNIRSSYTQDVGDLNVKRIHWMFHELPVTTHTDVLMKRMSHMDWVVQKVVKVMNIEWEPKKEGETKAHKNYIEHVYARMLNDKRFTVVRTSKDNSEKHRTPYVKSPKSLEQSGFAPNYKRGKRFYYWKSRAEGEKQVSGFWMITFT